jgi:hypothetical protein
MHESTKFANLPWKAVAIETLQPRCNIPLFSHDGCRVANFNIYSGHGCFLFIGKMQPQRENLLNSVITDMGRKWTKEAEQCVITLDF